MQNELLNNGKPAGLMAYIDDQSKQGIISDAIANGLKYSVKKVLSATMENWMELPLAELDLNEIAKKYKKLPHENIKETTFNAYLIRARRAINAYNEFLRSGKSVMLTKRPQNAAAQEIIGMYCNGVNRSARSTLINYPFVLSNGVIILLSLPIAGLKPKDAARLKEMIDTVVIKP